jgi:chromosome partitioning protein
LFTKASNHKCNKVIISLLNQKGGAGKTTIAINLAYAIAETQVKVLLVDSDPQGSARDWGTVRSEPTPFTLIGIDRPILHQEVPKLSEAYDYTIIDGAPRVTDLTRSAILASDQVLIPVQPSPLDVWASAEVVTLVREAKLYKPNLKCNFVINRKITNSLIAKEVIDALSQYGIPILNAQISQRVIFADAFSQGSVVSEYDPKSTALAEIYQLREELIGATN